MITYQTKSIALKVVLSQPRTSPNQKHYLDVMEGDFNEIKDGDTVEFTIELNDKGNEVAKNIRKVSEELYDFNFEEDDSLYNQ